MTNLINLDPKIDPKKIMLTDVIYQKPKKETQYHDYINIIYKSIETLDKRIITIKDPLVRIYIVKEEYRDYSTTLPEHFVPVEHCTLHYVQYRNVLKFIADEAGGRWAEMFYSGDYTLKRELYKYPFCRNADIDIETVYRCEWDDYYGNDSIVEPTKIYLDIEINQKNYTGALSSFHGECPIDLVTFIDGCRAESYTFALDMGDNPQIKEVMDNMDNVVKKMDDIIDKYNLGKIKHNFYFFEDERKMLLKIWEIIKYLERDMGLIWNMEFDINYMIERMQALGMDPNKVMGDDRFPTETLYYHHDKKRKSFNFATSRDYFTVSGFTKWMCQMRNYGALRRSESQIQSYALDDIAKKEVGMGKLDHSENGNFKTFSYENYEKYFIYNIVDVVCQYAIDIKTHDSDNIYYRTINDCIPFKDVAKQTLTFRASLFKHNHKVNTLCNNINFDCYDEEDEDSYEGAIVGNPLLNNFNGLKILGFKSRFLFGYSIDFDFKAMHTSLMIAFNLFASCMIGKLLVGNEDTDSYDAEKGIEFIENLIASNPIYLGEKWFNLPSFYDLNEIIMIKYGSKIRKELDV